MDNLNSHNFEDIYKKLDISLEKLGCVMIDIDGKKIKNPIPEDALYVSENKTRFWINGFVAGETPHVTLLYGLLKPANTWKKHIDEVLKDWEIGQITINDIGYFDSPYKDEEYYCIVAHVKVTPELLEGHERLQFLPHIDTFTGYKAHITLAYIKKDDAIRDSAINFYKSSLIGKDLNVIGLNLSGDKNV